MPEEGSARTGLAQAIACGRVTDNTDTPGLLREILELGPMPGWRVEHEAFGPAHVSDAMGLRLIALRGVEVDNLTWVTAFITPLTNARLVLFTLVAAGQGAFGVGAPVRFRLEASPHPMARGPWAQIQYCLEPEGVATNVVLTRAALTSWLESRRRAEALMESLRRASGSAPPPRTQNTSALEPETITRLSVPPPIGWAIVQEPQGEAYEHAESGLRATFEEHMRAGGVRCLVLCLTSRTEGHVSAHILRAGVDFLGAKKRIDLRITVMPGNSILMVIKHFESDTVPFDCVLTASDVDRCVLEKLDAQVAMGIAHRIPAQ